MYTDYRSNSYKNSCGILVAEKEDFETKVYLSLKKTLQLQINREVFDECLQTFLFYYS